MVDRRIDKNGGRDVGYEVIRTFIIVTSTGSGRYLIVILIVALH